MAKTLTWLGLGAILAVAAWRLPATAQIPPGGFGGDAALSGLGAGDLITHYDAADGRAAALTVVDSRARVIAVYHLNRETGEIQLKSVRNIRWDLAMEDFNSGTPLPAEIRKGIEGRQ